ncbi:trypsin-like serine protease [Rathayibacter iranicus]|nr:trypsin-like serine protease [Rathayibacter iranicus]MWV31295.1 hypothetical protein [Rathayibacter iranicus NCPPB 2253 = VKM Ac-1602]PWJ63644.1 hypothetical protein B0H03_107113 [Rathayibacter iranicus NCPPB 2253 = VKM Ac-1602]
MPSHSYRRRLSRGLTSLLLVVAAVIGVATPANAEDPVRLRTPIVAGTTVLGPLENTCTVGAVLKRNGPGSLLSPFMGAVRYLVLAKHCAPELGMEFTLNSVVIGRVSWLSATDDLELVQVAPEVTPPRGCYSSINGCYINSLARPRAVGQVILRGIGGERPVPMLPPASPAPGERFCTSGSTTGVNCNWIVYEGGTGRWREPGVAQAFATNAQGVDHGDSGGPVVSQQGQFIGIIQKGGGHGRVNIMQYMPVAELVLQLDHEFDIAPR